MLNKNNIIFLFIWLISVWTLNFLSCLDTIFIEFSDFIKFQTFYEQEKIVLLHTDIEFIRSFFNYYPNINIHLTFNTITYKYFFTYVDIKNNLKLTHQFLNFWSDDSYNGYTFLKGQPVCYGSLDAIAFSYLLFGVFALPKTFLLPFVSLGFGGDFNLPCELQPPLPSDFPLTENFQQVENSNNNNSLNKNLQASDLHQNNANLPQPIVETKSNSDLLPALSVAGLVANTPFIIQVLENRLPMSKSKIHTFISTMPKTARNFNDLKLVELWDNECIHTIKGRTIHPLSFQPLKNEAQLEKIKLLNSRVCSLSKDIVKKDYKDVKRHSQFFLKKSLQLTPEIIEKLDNWTFCKLVLLEKEYPYSKK